MNKVTVKRVIPISDLPHFEVSVNGKVIRVFSFMFAVEADSIYHEERNRQSAMELAHKLEENTTQEETVIYETPQTKKDEE